MKGRPIFYLVLLIASSCAVSYQKAADSLKNSPIRLRTTAELTYDPLDAKGTSFKLDECSDAFMFPTGKSFFKAFRLPDRSVPYYLHVRSFALGETVESAHIFYPQLALLDGKFSVLKQSDPAGFSLKKAGFRETASVSWNALRIKLEGAFPVEYPEARYLVVYTTDALLRSVSPYWALKTTPLILPGIVGVVPLGKKNIHIHHSPFGFIQIDVAEGPLPPDGADEEAGRKIPDVSRLNPRFKDEVRHLT